MGSEKQAEGEQEAKSPDRGPSHRVPMALGIVAVVCAGIVLMAKPNSAGTKDDKPTGASAPAATK